ncbi:hypothetical protein RHMOL_Rhmol13G0248800 [Rhododendron molle]|uniref:Uncharacterized protein n=1 Tax=Rhododendron molle TaxID=49168 RepID=A0ACC0LAE7_RHOML|nr:hypothetical protein RHMOL_Rhmol13G0248800 [Rhododendron molle]
MTSYSWNSDVSNFGSNCLEMLEPFSGNLGNLGGNWGGGSDSVSAAQSLVLDGERGELVKAPIGVGKKSVGVPEEKVVAALKSHSEAERRRRERINAHLNTLRGLVPCTEKMDKAALLAEVITQVKQLQKTARESATGLIIPMDDDEVRVEPHHNEDGSFSLRVSLCCDYRPELMSELRQALESLHLNTVKAEISTLGDRIKNVFVFTSRKDIDSENAESCQLLVNSVHQALSGILDKASASAEYSPRTTLPTKRRRTSYVDSSSSSS